MSDFSYCPATCLTSMFGSQIVNGPEVLSKFVGETEKNVRDLFNLQMLRMNRQHVPRGMVSQKKLLFLFTLISFYLFVSNSVAQFRRWEWPSCHHLWWNWCYLQGKSPVPFALQPYIFSTYFKLSKQGWGWAVSFLEIAQCWISQSHYFSSR